MQREIETKIENWDGGIKHDSRDPSKNTCRMVTNFDTFTNRRKLVPYNASEDASLDSDGDRTKIKNYTIARQGTQGGDPADNYRLYGLGEIAVGSKLEIFSKKLTTGGTNDLGDIAWAKLTAGQFSSVAATGDAEDFNFFIFWERTRRVYGAHGGGEAAGVGQLWQHDPNVALSESILALNFTYITQGVIHSKRNELAVAYYYDGAGVADDIVSAVAVNDGTGVTSAAWNLTALSLPKHLRATQIVEYGNFYAISCMPVGRVGNSVVFLWDGATSLADVSDSIDWGEGQLKVLGSVGGELIGISVAGRGVSGDTIAASHKDRLTFRNYPTAQGAKVFEEIIATETGTILPIAKQVANNRLYFMAQIEIAGAERDGVFSVGRNKQGEFSIVHEATPENDTTDPSNFHGFYLLGDFLFQSYTLTNEKVSKTNQDVFSTKTAIYETKIYDGSEHGFDGSWKKDLLGVTLVTEPLSLTLTSKVIVKYRIDDVISDDGAWTTLLTHDVLDADGGETVKRIFTSVTESLPKSYSEIQFRIESTEGAEVVKSSFNETVTGQDRAYE